MKPTPVRAIVVSLMLGVTLGCSTPRSRAQSSPDVKQDLSLTLKDAQGLFDKGDWRQTRRVAMAAIAQVRGDDKPSKTVAELYDINAYAAFMALDFDMRDASEAALRAWESLPNEEARIARALEWLSFALNLGADLREAELQVRRCIALYERLYGSQAPALLGPLYTLLDLLDQECRVDESVAHLARVRGLIAAHPNFDSKSSFFAGRLEAYIARRQGDLERAVVLLRSATEQLAALEGSRSQLEDRQSYVDVAYDSLADFSLDLGKYDDMLRFVEKQTKNQSSRVGGELNVASELFFAYQANNDERSETHARSVGLRYVSGGDVLFPKVLARIEPCSPDRSEEPRGWLHRAPNAEDALERCLVESATQSEFAVLVRVENGKCVAAEAAGFGTDEALLRCAVDSVLGLPVAGPHDFNFITLAVASSH